MSGTKRGRPRKLPPIEKELNKYPFSGVHSMEDLMKLLDLDDPRQAHMAELSHTKELCQKEGCILYQLQDNRQKCAFHQRSWYPKPSNVLRRFRGNFCVHRSFLAVGSNTKANASQRGCACNDQHCIGIGNAPFGSLRFPLNRAKLDVAIRFMSPVLGEEKIEAIRAHPKSYFMAPWHFWPAHRKIIDTENEFVMKVDTQQESYANLADPDSPERFIFPPPTYPPKRFYEEELVHAPYLKRFRFNPLVLPSWVSVYQTLEAKTMKVEHDQRQIAKRQKLLEGRRLEKERENEKKLLDKQEKEHEKAQREQHKQQREQERQQEKARRQKEKELKKQKGKEYKELERLLGKERAKELSEFERDLIRQKVSLAEVTKPKSPFNTPDMFHSAPTSMMTTFGSIYPAPATTTVVQRSQSQKTMMPICIPPNVQGIQHVSPQVSLQVEAQQVVAQVAQRSPIPYISSPSSSSTQSIRPQIVPQGISMPVPPLMVEGTTGGQFTNQHCTQDSGFVTTVHTHPNQVQNPAQAPATQQREYPQPAAQYVMNNIHYHDPSDSSNTGYSSPVHTEGSFGNQLLQTSNAHQSQMNPNKENHTIAINAENDASDKDGIISRLRAELRQVKQALAMKTELNDLSQARLTQRERDLRELKERMLGLAHGIQQ